MTESYGSVEKAAEAYTDIKAGIEPVSSEPEEKPYYKNEDEALAAVREKGEAIAEVETHQQRIDTSNKNKQERDSSLSLNPNHAQQIAEYQSRANKLNAEHQALNKVLNELDMNKLRKESPAEFAALSVEISDVRARLERDRNDLMTSANAIQNGVASQVLDGERSKLLKKAPELANEKVQAQVREYLLNSGVTQEEIESTVDHRVVLQAYKAMKHEKRQEAKGSKSTKLKKANKKHINAAVKQAAERFENTRSIGDLRSLMDAKAKTKTNSKPSKSKIDTSEMQSRVLYLKSIVNKNPNSRNAMDAAAEIMGLQRKIANA